MALSTFLCAPRIYCKKHRIIDEDGSPWRPSSVPVPMAELRPGTTSKRRRVMVLEEAEVEENNIDAADQNPFL